MGALTKTDLDNFGRHIARALYVALAVQTVVTVVVVVTLLKVLH
jgi:hypothetical protein